MTTLPRNAVGEGAPASPRGCQTIGSWLLTPEGGIIHRAGRTGVVADVHLGYEWARGAGGDCIPAHSLAETQELLESFLGRSPVDRLVVAGDLVESVRPCRRSARDVGLLRRWLEDRAVQLVLLRGNHDTGLEWLVRDGEQGLEASGLGFLDELVVDGWRIVHGHGQTPPGRVILGHHHPVLRASGRSFRCFLAGPRKIMLPAFSANAAGLDVSAPSVAGSKGTSSLRCLASSGEELLDLGTLRDFAARLRPA